MSLKRLIDVGTVAQLLKKNIINKEGVRILDCTYDHGLVPNKPWTGSTSKKSSTEIRYDDVGYHKRVAVVHRVTVPRTFIGNSNCSLYTGDLVANFFDPKFPSSNECETRRICRKQTDSP
ncbi:hypothetical protein COOONC_03901 [Cooperia oncophora]